MQYKLHLTLQQSAALKIATSFWEKKEVKDKVAESLKSFDKLESYEIRRKWGEFMKTIIDEWNKDLLPQKVEVGLIHIVKMIGERIFSWYYYIKDQYGTEREPINCIDKMYWTSYGTVDAIETFKSYWLNNPNLDITKVYNFACSYVMVEHINELWNKILSDIQDHHYNDTYYHFDRHILAYWKCCRDGDLPNLIRYFEIAAEDFNMHEFNVIYDINLSTEENMLRLSARQGHFLALKYFWEKLTEEQRDENVLKCARIAVLRCSYRDSKKIQDYKISQYAEICIFLMNQMTKSHKKAFFNERLRTREFDVHDTGKLDVRDEILGMLMSGWPWQELFMPIFKDMLQLLDDNSKMVCKFLDSITQRMLDDHWLGYSTEMSFYRSLLRKVWLILPETVKQNPKYDMHTFISDLIDVWDLDSLKLILNDPVIATVKDEYIGFALYSYDQLAVHDQYEILEEFIREICKTEEDKKRFKQYIDPWHTFILEDDFRRADKLVDWLSNSPEERQHIKNGIEYKIICEDLIKAFDFILVDKFIDWRFETEEEKKNCKNYFKSGKFVMNWICEIWKENDKNINKSKNESFQFLYWLLESEEEIVRFKKELFVNLEMNQTAMLYLNQLDRKGIMKDLFLWCLLPDEEVQRIKQVMLRQN